ncbi:MAG: DUF1638 domain-containing protein [Sedimentisphaeraceae bacterium JB056]
MLTQKKPLRLKFVVCGVLRREAYYCAANSKNIVEVCIVEQGLHNEPQKLKAQLQKILTDTTDSQGNTFDAIIMGYGLCSNGIIGLSSPLPVIVPRAHDCVTLLLGSKEKYQEYFDSHRGIYWYSCGWIESTPMPGKERVEDTRKEYIEKYGEDNADFLMEMEQNWMKEYEWATFINWPFDICKDYAQYTKECAGYMNWKYDQVDGSSGLIQRMVDGDWDNEDFLTLEPGTEIEEDLTCSGIIKASSQS